MEKEKKVKDKGEKQKLSMSHLSLFCEHLLVYSHLAYGIAAYATSNLPTTSYNYGGGGFSNYSTSSAASYSISSSNCMT
jgi:hypothetical protein